MKDQITCFVPLADKEQVAPIIEELSASPMVSRVVMLTTDEQLARSTGREDILYVPSLQSTEAIFTMARMSRGTPYLIYYTKYTPLRLGYLALERMVQVMENTHASMVYADRYQQDGDEQRPAPVIDYQRGSLRDDFEFGSVMMFRANVFRATAVTMSSSYQFAGLYDLRLRLSERAPIVHIDEYLYTEVLSDRRKSGEKIFDYVDPRNRESQIEMERACTDYLRSVGAYISPDEIKPLALDATGFTCEASVIIPVRNRVRTIEDAVRSVLSQQASFDFNLIVIDNHSTDGTTDILRRYAADDPRVIHLIPERNDLGIGGCWNLGVQHDACGRFAVQLDSDDIYKDEHTLRTVVETFHREQCAMVIGSYQMTDFHLQPIPPGLIDHKEWTPENGHNNALRVNGLGAPRAFYTPLLRALPLPNTSYGEDYAIGLTVSRNYRIGRIYDPIYICRRWEDNSDAALDVTRSNRNNFYKDKIRTWELQARIRMHEEIS